jgi:hypothetical protein
MSVIRPAPLPPTQRGLPSSTAEIAVRPPLAVANERSVGLTSRLLPASPRRRSPPGLEPQLHPSTARMRVTSETILFTSSDVSRLLPNRYANDTTFSRC